jgi:hypothetical protein
VTLQGSLDAFPLPDVLGLLASTKKAGELLVRGTWSDGRVWVNAGELVDAEAPRATNLVDAIFELLRLEEGSFVFDPNASVPDGPSQPVEPVLMEAQARLDEWRIIEAVVPSVDTPVSLAPRAPSAKVGLSAEQWRIVVAIGSGGTVEAVANELGLGEFGACAAVKTMVDAGLLVVDGVGAGGPFDFTSDPQADQFDDFLTPEPAKAKRTSRRVSGPGSAAAALYDAAADVDVSTAVASLTAEKARELAAELAELGTPAAEAVEAAAAAPTDEERALALTEALTDEDGQPINRGLLLKFLSSVRS